MGFCEDFEAFAIYYALASLLFISCGKKQKAETTEQNKEAAKVEVPLQPTDQAVAFIKLQAEEASVMLSTNTRIIWLLVWESVKTMLKHASGTQKLLLKDI